MTVLHTAQLEKTPFSSFLFKHQYQGDQQAPLPEHGNASE